jgi:transposase
MAPFDLTRPQRSWLQHQIASTAEARIRRRAQALLGLAQGDTPSEVAQRLRVSRQTLSNGAHHLHQRSDLGLPQRLADRPRRGRPRTAHGIIDPLLWEVIDDDPRDGGYRATVWTAPLLREYRSDIHDRDVSRPSVSAALDRLRLHGKRPRHRLARRPATWRQAKGA